jgi:cysteine-rich repeat protein
MCCRTFIVTVALWCVALSAACNGSSPQVSASGDTEVNLLISDPALAAEEFATLIDFVSYRIICLDSGVTPTYDDSVDLAGNFESDGNASPNPAVWTLVADLPLSPCTISLWVFYEDEVVCSGSQVLSIVEDDNEFAPNKANIVLDCSLSVTPPSGDLDIDGSFSFIHGNYCPQLFWLGTFPSTDPTVMNIQTSSIDVDSSCGQNCDPQTCDFNLIPPVCTPGQDLGLTSTLSAPAGNGSLGDPTAFNTTYTCDPLFPGPTEICVSVSDGDLDCDQMRCITIDCPDLCEGAVCDDGNECTRDACDPLTGLCNNDDAPDGIACDNCNSTCQLGACDAGTPFTATVNAAVMNIVGSFQALNTTVTNPYSGETIPLSGQYFVNTSSYKGIGTSDLFIGSIFSDVLFVYDLAGVPPESAQRLCGVESLRADNGFDVMLLADDFIVLANMEIFGGNADDTLWANAGDDTIHGLNGRDRIDGGPGDDIIEGGNANDAITLWPGGGFDSIFGGDGITDNSVLDQVEIDAIQSQILISPALNPSYQFDIFYLGIPMAQVTGVELLVMNDATIDLTLCTGGAGDVCNLCGNDALNGSEECDDGNNASGDGCAADCTAEY